MTLVAATTSVGELEQAFEQHRRELVGYCYRMLGSPFDAEDAVQETMLRAWRGIESFQGRAALRSWLYRIATNVCLDSLSARCRRARPMDLGPAGEPVAENLNVPAEITWIEPIPDTMVGANDPAEQALARETLRLAFIAALQRLPARQRAALILCEVFRWKATEAAELLETSVASINSALQRARATLDETGAATSDPLPAMDAADQELLTAVIREDAIQSMPPFDLWLQGRDDVLAWFVGPGIGCSGSRLIAVE